MTTDWREWSDALTERVARAVKRRRTVLGLTAAELADRTSIGKPLTRAVISDLETRRKKSLEVSELLTLAAALDIPPILLLFPDYPDGSVEVVPGEQRTSPGAFGWFAGGDSGPSGDAPPSLGMFLVLAAHESFVARREWMLARALEVTSGEYAEDIAGLKNKVELAEQQLRLTKERVWGEPDA